MTDIVERLRFVEQRLRCIPVELGEPKSTVEGAAQCMREAADLIERLRSIVGKADPGQSFAEITKDMSRRPADYEMPRAADAAP